MRLKDSPACFHRGQAEALLRLKDSPACFHRKVLVPGVAPEMIWANWTLTVTELSSVGSAWQVPYSCNPC